MADTKNDEPMVELRFDVPRAVFDVVDAVRIARRLTKDAVGRMIVTEWAREQTHIAKLLGNVTRGKVIEPPSQWGDDV